MMKIKPEKKIAVFKVCSLPYIPIGFNVSVVTSKINGLKFVKLVIV